VTIFSLISGAETKAHLYAVATISSVSICSTHTQPSCKTADRRVVRLLKQILSGPISGTIMKGHSQKVRMRPLWRCPKCSRRFANRNQEHSCGRYSVEDFLRGRDPGAIALYRAFERLVLGLGPILLAPAKTRVGFQARMIFAAVNQLSRDKLQAHVVLARRLECSRFTRIETISMHNHVHHFMIERVDELDNEVLGWLREAYRVGLQEHLRRTS
jgi:hypothetical protein